MHVSTKCEICNGFCLVQDGSCNGLQHYAALGGDTLGAISVNLKASDKPQDVYTSVAERVAALVERGRLQLLDLFS